MVNLADLGWDAAWEAAFASHTVTGLQPGRVALEDKQAFSVMTAEGEVTARTPGRMFHRTPSAARPKVGDWVALSWKPGDSRAVIQHVLPRRTTLVRKMPGRETEPQLLAANVDVAFIVQALDQRLSARRLERYLVMIHAGGAQAVVVLNKADLADGLDERLAEVAGWCAATPLVAVSARTGSGLAGLRQFLAPGRTCVFVGASGAGKSSLINELYGEAVQPTLEVRERDGKGRHTTSWREMILLPQGGLVIDTPGMREFHLWVAEGGLEEAFPEVAELALRCHFRACSHSGEDRCAIRAALDNGTLAQGRFDSFQKLRRELDVLAGERRGHTYLVRRRQSGLRRRPRTAPDEPWD